MFDKVKNILKSRAPFDPSVFNDPVATQTEWHPLKPGGTNFRTHTLVKTSPDRIEFRATFMYRMFGLIFAFIGIAMILLLIYLWLIAKTSEANSIWPVGAVGLAFSLVGCVFFFLAKTPIVFDKKHGFFWKGKPAPYEVFDKSRLTNFAGLNQVHAIQLLSERCTGKNNSFYSYEMNLILKNGKRLNVVDHGNAEMLRNDAATLSAFLQKPVWSAIDAQNLG